MRRHEETDWARRRRQAIDEHAAAREQARAVEAAQAQDLLACFVRDARAKGVRDTALTAQAYHGRTRYRTGLRGWYLRADRGMAVGTDGEFYLLSVPPSLRALFVGMRLVPDEPRMIIGEGARDGESIPLAALLRRRLEAGDR